MPPQYLDEQGNAVQYLDENGNPVASSAAGNPPVSQSPLPTGATTQLEANEPNVKPQSWRDATIGNPFEGGPAAMMRRSADYLKGEGQGVLGAMKAPISMAEGIIKDPESVQMLPGQVAEGLKQTVTAPAKMQTYADPRQMGAEVANVASFATPEGVKGTGEMAADLGTAVDTAKLDANARGRLSAAQVEAQSALKNGRTEYANRIYNKTEGIRRKDAANPLPNGAQMTVDPIENAVNAQTVNMNAQTRLNMPNVAKIEDLTAKARQSGPLTFARLQQLRSDIGQIAFNRNMPPVEKNIATAAYQQATDMMAQRAAQLGEADAFNKYNAEFTALKQLDHDYLNDLTEFNAKPTEFFRTIGDKGNAVVQNMLDRFGQHGDVARQINKEAGPLVTHLNRPTGMNVMGRMGAVMKHPGYALAGSALGGVAGHAVGMPWVGEMLGATVGATLGDRMAAARTLREGSPYAMGAKAVREGGEHAMLPEQTDWQSGPAQKVPPRMSTKNPAHPDDRFNAANNPSPPTAPKTTEAAPKTSEKIPEEVKSNVGSPRNQMAYQRFGKLYKDLTKEEKQSVAVMTGEQGADTYVGPERRSEVRDEGRFKVGDVHDQMARSNLGKPYDQLSPDQKASVDKWVQQFEGEGVPEMKPTPKMQSKYATSTAPGDSASKTRENLKYSGQDTQYSEKVRRGRAMRAWAKKNKEK